MTGGYGHRQKGACPDIETVVPAGPVDRDAFQQVVDGINPSGRTPLSAAVRHAAEGLSMRDAPAIRLGTQLPSGGGPRGRGGCRHRRPA